MNIVFFSSGTFGVPTLEELLRSKHQVSYVVTQPDRPAGRGRSLTPTPVAEFAMSRGLPLLKTENVNAMEMLGRIAQFGPDLLIVIAFGQKLSDNLLTLASLGGINLHGSILPEFRGAAPINWAILSGAAHTGVSIIRVSNRIDAGDIIAMNQTPIGDNETAGELHDRLAKLGAPLMIDVVDRIESGEMIPAIHQDESQKSIAPKLSRAMGWLDFSQNAQQVSSRIRGLSPWPGCAADVINPQGNVRIQVTILKSRANPDAAIPAGAICGSILEDRTVVCGRGTITLITLQPGGKKAMDLPTFVNGYGLGAGYRLKSVLPPPGTPE